ncbi:hypothetical protein O9K51_07045 [Purpureocillium lavendulum]|uniref:Uncharacterized protein n=1 Tax=Purpureocillium lavendulum TaxID=1247861 RepID=A0AB34FPE5_9HYPO|nr:hypothetical protein O9K51_07045 [Purpureocillium lavendulum]
MSSTSAARSSPSNAADAFGRGSSSPSAASLGVNHMAYPTIAPSASSTATVTSERLERMRADLRTTLHRRRSASPPLLSAPEDGDGSCASASAGKRRRVMTSVRGSKAATETSTMSATSASVEAARHRTCLLHRAVGRSRIRPPYAEQLAVSDITARVVPLFPATKQSVSTKSREPIQENPVYLCPVDRLHVCVPSAPESNLIVFGMLSATAMLSASATLLRAACRLLGQVAVSGGRAALARLGPPLRDGLGLGDPGGGVLAVGGANLALQARDAPGRGAVQLERVVVEVGEDNLRLLVAHWQDDAPRHVGRRDGEEAAARVDDAKVPGAAPVVRRAVGADQRLALVVVHEVRGRGRVLLVERARAHEQVEDGRDDGHGRGVVAVVHARQLRVAEDDGHAEVAHVAVCVGARLVEVLLEGLAVVADEDGQRLVGDAEVVEQLHHHAHPHVVEAHRVEVLVELLVLAALAHVVDRLEPVGHAPRVVRRAGKVRQEHALVVGRRVGDVVAQVRLERRLGVPKVVDLFERRVRRRVLVHDLLLDDGVEADLELELVLPVVRVGDGHEEGRVPQLLEVVGRVGAGAAGVAALDLVEEVEDLRDARLVAVGLGLLKHGHRHGPHAAVAGGHALGRRAAGRVAADDGDAAVAGPRAVVPHRVTGGRVRRPVGAPEVARLAADLLGVGRQLRQERVDLVVLAGVVRAQDDLVDARVLLQREQLLARALHLEEGDVLDVDARQRLPQRRQHLLVEVGDAERVVDGVVEAVVDGGGAGAPIRGGRVDDGHDGYGTAVLRRRRRPQRRVPAEEAVGDGRGQPLGDPVAVPLRQGAVGAGRPSLEVAAGQLPAGLGDEGGQRPGAVDAVHRLAHEDAHERERQRRQHAAVGAVGVEDGRERDEEDEGGAADEPRHEALDEGPRRALLGRQQPRLLVLVVKVGVEVGVGVLVRGQQGPRRVGRLEQVAADARRAGDASQGCRVPALVSHDDDNNNSNTEDRDRA